MRHFYMTLFLALLALLSGCHRNMEPKGFSPLIGQTVALNPNLPIDSTKTWQSHSSFNQWIFLGANGIHTAVAQIQKINRLESESIGFIGMKGRAYENFEILSSMASDSQLLALTLDTNAVLVAYACWALIDRAYEDVHAPNHLAELFERFIDDKRRMTTMNGCTMMESSIASEIYNRCANKTFDDVFAHINDPILSQLDQILDRHPNARGYSVDLRLDDGTRRLIAIDIRPAVF